MSKIIKWVRIGNKIIPTSLIHYFEELSPNKKNPNMHCVKMQFNSTLDKRDFYHFKVPCHFHIDEIDDVGTYYKSIIKSRGTES